jgi:hypothetical protein
MGGYETDNQRSVYRAFLVRLWQDTPGAPWRASAQSVHAREVVRFASAAQLFHYLRCHIAEIPVHDAYEAETLTGEPAVRDPDDSSAVHGPADP